MKCCANGAGITMDYHMEIILATLIQRIIYQNYGLGLISQQKQINKILMSHLLAFDLHYRNYVQFDLYQLCYVQYTENVWAKK